MVAKYELRRKLYKALFQDPVRLIYMREKHRCCPSCQERVPRIRNPCIEMKRLALVE